MNVKATEARNRFGQVLEAAQSQPVFIEKAGRRHSVVLSNQRFETLVKVEAEALLVQRHREFNVQYQDWIAEQNQRVATHGLWNDEFRRW